MNNEIIKWLGRIPDKDIANLAIRRHIERPRNSEFQTDLPESAPYGRKIQWALNYAFEWGETEEGHSFWSRRHSQARTYSDPDGVTVTLNAAPMFTTNYIYSTAGTISIDHETYDPSEWIEVTTDASGT